jgi:hypothetical protein
LGNLGFGQVLEFGQSKVNFVFFGGKAMFVNEKLRWTKARQG